VGKEGKKERMEVREGIGLQITVEPGPLESCYATADPLQSSVRREACVITPPESR